MKQTVNVKPALLALIYAFLLSACEKAVIDESNGDGNFHVSVFEIEKTPFASLTRGDTRLPTRAAEPLSEVCTRLNFAIYSPEGTRVKQTNQTSGDDDFGNVSFKLEKGNYQLLVVAHSAGGNPTMTNPSKIQFTNATGYTDTFIYKGSVTIGDEQVSLQVSLERIVAMCRFVITDDIPTDVATMQFHYTGGSGCFDASTGLGSVASKQTATFDVSSGVKQFDLYTFLHDREGDIALKATALDAGGNTLYERDFEVPMERNRITWLAGVFFTGANMGQMSIGAAPVDTAWEGETHLTF